MSLLVLKEAIPPPFYEIWWLRALELLRQPPTWVLAVILVMWVATRPRKS